MLSVNRITKSFATQLILKDISFTVNAGDRLALVGSNGCGKTTLLRIICGQEKADAGTVLFHPVSLRVGYLPQGFDFLNGQSVGDYIDSIQGGQEQLTVRLEETAERLSQQPDDPDLQSLYDEILAQLIASGENQHRAETILPALGLASIPRTQPAATLSGGQKTRLALAGVLVSAPQLLILDEPTNHLDLNMLGWLEEWLPQQPGALLMVSHDRTFLDHIATGILELDDQTHQLKYYGGNYSDYLDQKQMELENHWQQYQDQREEIRRLTQAAQRIREKSRPTSASSAPDNDKFARAFFNNRKLELVRRAKGIEKRIDVMQTDERIDKPRPSWQMKMIFGETTASGRDALVMEDLAVGYDEKPLISSINLTVRFASRVVLVGENGVGKTTLLRTLMGEIAPLAGRCRFGSQVKPGYMSQEQQDQFFKVDPFTTLSNLSHASETEVRRFLSFYLFTNDEVFTPIERLSYGERARLALACMVSQGYNFLLLDEPTNHLDIPSRTRFENALESFEGTLLVISHDRYFIDQFATEIWEMRDQKIRIIQKTLD